MGASVERCERFAAWRRWLTCVPENESKRVAGNRKKSSPYSFVSFYTILGVFEAAEKNLSHRKMKSETEKLR